MSEIIEREGGMDEEKRQPSHGSKKSRGKKEGRKGGDKVARKKEKARGIAVAKGDRAGRGQSEVSGPGIRQEPAKARREGKGGGDTSEGNKKHPVGKRAPAATKNKQKLKNGSSSSVIGPLSGESIAVLNGSKGAPASTSPTTLSVKQKKLVRQNKAKNKKGNGINHEIDGSKNAAGKSGTQRKRDESTGDGVAAPATKKWPSVKRKKKVGHCLFSESSFLDWVFKYSVWGGCSPREIFIPSPSRFANLSPQRTGCMQSNGTAWGRYWLKRFC